MNPQAAISIGTIASVVLVAVLKVLFDRRDKRKAEEAKIETIPDNPDGVAAARDRVRRIEAAQHVQPERNP